MWIEVRLRPKGGGPWNGQAFREFAARALSNMVPPRLFWRAENGIPLPGIPTITFIGRETWVGMRVCSLSDSEQDQIVARDDGIMMLRSLQILAKAMDREWGRGHAVEILSGDHKIQPKQFTHYRISKLALSRTWARTHRDNLMKFLPPKGNPSQGRPLNDEHREAVRNTILSGLRARFPEHQGLFLDHLVIENNLKWGTPLTAGGDLVFVVPNIEFTLPHRIIGPVQVGGLQSRGLGNITRNIYSAVA